MNIWDEIKVDLKRSIYIKGYSHPFSYGQFKFSFEMVHDAHYSLQTTTKYYALCKKKTSVDSTQSLFHYTRAWLISCEDPRAISL